MRTMSPLTLLSLAAFSSFSTSIDHRVLTRTQKRSLVAVDEHAVDIDQRNLDGPESAVIEHGGFLQVLGGGDGS